MILFPAHSTHVVGHLELLNVHRKCHLGQDISHRRQIKCAPHSYFKTLLTLPCCICNTHCKLMTSDCFTTANVYLCDRPFSLTTLNRPQLCGAVLMSRCVRVQLQAEPQRDLLSTTPDWPDGGWQQPGDHCCAQGSICTLSCS